MIRWIKNWLLSDRIRITPGHSRLFQLEVGDRVLVRDRLWAISKRQVDVAGSNVHVQFELVEEGVSSLDSVSLWLVLGNDARVQPTVNWDGPGLHRELFEEEITILKS